MRFAYLANVRFPSERAHAAQIAHMCQAFVESGHTVTLYASARSGDALGAVGKTFGFEPTFLLQTIGTQQFFGDTKFAFFLRELIFVISFWRQYEKGSADVIYSRDEWVLYLLSFLLPKERLVYESHEAKYNRAVRRLVQRGVRIVVISEGIRDFYLTRSVAVEKMLVAHDAIDDSFLETPISQATARDTLKLPHDMFIAMYVGGFDPWKGVETFFKAAARVPEVLFVAIGGKPEEVDRYTVQYPQVRFLGQRPYRELQYHQQAADVLVIPNTATNELSAKYTSPLKLFAHMASGVPIVASDIPSIRNVVTENATFFAADDESDLCKKIQTVQAAYDTYKNQAGKLRLQSAQHTWTNRAEAITTFIDQTK